MKSVWTNKKHPGHKYEGSYSRLRGERVFELTRTNGNRRITFESWQMAKKMGWRKK